MGNPAPGSPANPPRGRWRLVAVPVLLVAIAWGVYAAGRQVWAEHHLREAEKELEARHFTSELDHLRCCLRVRPESTDITLLAARAARRARAYPDAARFVKRYEELGGLPEAARLERTLAATQRGEFSPETERRLLAAAEGAGPDAGLILEALAQGEIQAFRWGPALQCLALLREREPGWAEPWLWQGWVLDNLSDVPGAVAAYRRAADLDAGSDEARVRLGAVLIRANELDEAAGLLEHARAARPDDPVVVLGLAHCRRAAGRMEEAAGLIDELLARQPDYAPAWAERGKVELARDRPAEAEPWLRKALEREPREADTAFQLATCLQRLGRTREAAEWEARFRGLEDERRRLEALLARFARSPGDRALRTEAGVLLLRSGREAEGVALLNTVLEEDATNREAHEALARHYEKVGKPALAARHRRGGR